jgi:hypothetical protein
MSERDIQAGTFWPEELWEQLKTANAGILCLTPEALGNGWIHFEAGAITKQTDKVRVCPYLYDLKISDVQPPLSFLTCCLATKEDTRKMLGDINATLQKPLQQEFLDAAFVAQWPQFKKELEAVPPATTPSPKPERDPQEILEEILAIVRELRSKPAEPLETITGRLGQLLLESVVRKSLASTFDAKDFEKYTVSSRGVVRVGPETEAPGTPTPGTPTISPTPTPGTPKIDPKPTPGTPSIPPKSRKKDPDQKANPDGGK